MDKSQSYLTASKHIECYDGLIKSYDLNKSLLSTYCNVYSLKQDQNHKDKDGDPSAGSDRGLKKRKTKKDAEPTKGPKAKESKYGSSKGTKYQPKSSGKSVQSEEPELRLQIRTCHKIKRRTRVMMLKNLWKRLHLNVTGSPNLHNLKNLLILIGMLARLYNQDKIKASFRLLKGTRSNYAELEYDFEECYKALSKKPNWENPKGGDYPFDLTKPLPLVMSGSHQKTKAAQYDLPGIEDMVPNIWVLVKVMRKLGYGYLKEIVVRRADNDLYRFKEGNFPRLHINDIEDMLLLFVQNRITNLSGDDVSDFAIALRMFTRSLVIKKRVEDLQLGVESYQKKINVTKPETTKSGIRRRDPYIPYQDPQGFIYVDNNGRNRLMRSDELYKFSYRTLIGLQTSLQIRRNLPRDIPLDSVEVLRLILTDSKGMYKDGRGESINGKKYILVIVDDYSQYTWTYFLISKDDTPEVLKDFFKMIQRNLQAQVIIIRTNRGTEFLNKTLHAYFKEEGIEHQTFTPQTPEQNGVVKTWNLTLIEAARTMISASKLSLFFWTEAIPTTCYT
ncbi:reverse transcriptase domain-containing protein [Tanacetum coccineum]|uniref:Reverse transcriptase domain-containing protein n=1 Tax=Tanacetum coccineum TaxID=301880 RepID=A0ABQ5I909_9ASTR